MQPKILVLGDLIIDEYVYGDATRISPEAPVPVVVEKSRKRVPGGAGNVVENLKALGAEVKFWCDEKFSHKLRVIAGRQQIVRVDNDDTREMYVPAALMSWIVWADAVVISDYAKGVVTQELADKASIFCTMSGKPLLVDPYQGRCDYGDRVTLIKPNKAECESVTGIKITDDESLEKAGYAYLIKSRAQSVVLTLGPDGMALFDGKTHSRHPYISRPQAQQVFDVTGAGDTAMAVLAFIIATSRPGQHSKQSMVDFANVAAGKAVGKLGTAVVSFDELFGQYLNFEEKGELAA